MEAPLLTTKLFIPPGRAGLVARPRLLECLKDFSNYSLVLVSAPAGFGKSTLVSEWVRQSKNKFSTAWVSLDEGDRDPIRFWDYFIGALRTLQPTAGETALTYLHSSQPYPAESIVTALINDLAAVPEDVVIVLDDYHLITNEDVHQGIVFLLDHLPPGMHIVIATRVEPSLPLPRFRVRGTMLEIGPDDLRFTLEEATAFLKDMAGAALSLEQVKALVEKTEGWAAGLKMAKLSTRGQKDIDKFITAFTGSQRYVMDYLVEEVLKRQPEEMRDFLLKTSVLERLTAPLCNTLTERSDSREMLAKLETTFSGFLIPLDESRQWYRYHHLFADLLRHQLETAFGSKEVTALHLQASRWYENNRFTDDAIHHAMAAKDWERAVKLISAIAEARLERGEMITLVDWLRGVPHEALRRETSLYSLYAHVLVETGQLDAGEVALNYLDRTAQGDANLQGQVAATLADLARRRGDRPRATELARRALSLLLPDSHAYRSRASWVLGLVLYDQGHYDEALTQFNDAYETGRQAGNSLFATDALVYIARIPFMQGNLRWATEVIQRGLELAGPSLASAMARTQMGMIQYERNDLEAAASSVKLGLEMIELSGKPDVRVSGYLFLAQIKQAQGDLAGSLDALDKADLPFRQANIRPGILAFRAAQHIILAIWRDDLATALQWSDRLAEHGDALMFENHRIPLRLLIARGEKAAAAKQLYELYEKTMQAGARGVAIQIRVYQALAAKTPEEALTFLTESLTMGQPEGYIRTFVDEGRLLAPLLRDILARGILPDYTSKLLNIIEAEERQRQARIETAALSHRATTKTVPAPAQSDGESDGASIALFEGTIRALLTAQESKDPYTASHQRRVTVLSQAIAVEMGLPKETREALKLAAMVHDLGKISVPLDILNKPGKVTNAEFGLIKEHPLTGFDILKTVVFPYPIAEIVYQHQERMDGSGYPRGLKNGEICLEARIIAVSDIVEAVTAHRPYRPALGIERALEEIKKGRGIGLDSAVVDACLKLFAEKAFKFE